MASPSHVSFYRTEQRETCGSWCSHLEKFVHKCRWNERCVLHWPQRDFSWVDLLLTVVCSYTFFLFPFEGQQCFYESPASDSAGWLLNCQGWLRNLLTYKLLRWQGNVNAWQSLLTEEISYCCHVLLGLRLMVLLWLEVWLLLFTSHLHKDHFGYGDDCNTAMFPWEPSVFCGWLEKRYLFWLTVSGSKSSRKHDGT